MNLGRGGGSCFVVVVAAASVAVDMEACVGRVPLFWRMDRLPMVDRVYVFRVELEERRARNECEAAEEAEEEVLGV